MTYMRDEGVKTIAIWVSLVVGVANLGVIVWKGGELSHMVKSDSLRIERLEAMGSNQLQSHLAVSEAIHKSTDARLAKLEQACESIAQIKESIIAIKKDMDWLTSRRTVQPTASLTDKPLGGSW